MNKERIMELADIIEMQAHVNYSDYPSYGFNMSSYRHNCGSPSCIAGWAAHLYAPESDRNISAIAAEVLGLDHMWALNNLFEVGLDIRYNDITPRMAATALRRCAAGMEDLWDAHN